jgi:hypothetical protein
MPISQITALALYGRCSAMLKMVERYAEAARGEPMWREPFDPLMTNGETIENLLVHLATEKRMALADLTGDPDFDVLADTPLFGQPASK